MRADETNLEMVQRHIREGERHIYNQRAVIERLKASNLPTGQAEHLLDIFEDIQREHEAHLVRIESTQRVSPEALVCLLPNTGFSASAPVAQHAIDP